MAAATRFLYTSFDSSVPSTSDFPQDTPLHTSPSSSTSASGPSLVTNALLRRIHMKSRRGCLNCKRRRIKCPENHPHCTQCTKRSLTCEWPEIQIEQARNDGKRVSRVVVPRQVDSPNTFSMQDFRLFNYFIQECHPFHPLGNEERWKHDIPAISHNHGYLLHSMLALAASDLYDANPNDTTLALSGMKHRVLAIESLSTALARGIHTMEEGNAMLGTCYTLVFQSALIADGYPEHMSFIRGCVVVAWQMGVKNLKFIFEGILSDDQLEMMGPFLSGAPAIDPDLTNGAIASLEACRHLVVKEAELAFHQCLLEIAQASQVSSRQTYIGIMKIYSIFAYYMSATDFHQFIYPDNQVGLLLQAHLIALQWILDPVLKNGQPGADTLEDRPYRPRHSCSVAWLDTIDSRVTDEMRPWFAWPLERRAQCKKSIAEKMAKLA